MIHAVETTQAPEESSGNQPVSDHDDIITGSLMSLCLMNRRGGGSLVKLRDLNHLFWLFPKRKKSVLHNSEEKIRIVKPGTHLLMWHHAVLFCFKDVKIILITIILMKVHFDPVWPAVSGSADGKNRLFVVRCCTQPLLRQEAVRLERETRPRQREALRSELTNIRRQTTESFQPRQQKQHINHHLGRM